MALRRQTRMFRPGNAIHEMGLATGHRSSLRRLRRNPPHRHRHRHFHPTQRNAHRQGKKPQNSFYVFKGIYRSCPKC